MITAIGYQKVLTADRAWRNIASGVAIEIDVHSRRLGCAWW
jgi:hypothetical protein